MRFWPVAKQIDAWKLERKGKRYAIGDVLVLHDVDQVFTLVNIVRWRRDGRWRANLCWQSHCVVCGAAYPYNIPDTFRAVVRTCPAHRGQWRSNVDRPRRRPRAVVPRATPIRDAIRDAMGELALIQDRASFDLVADDAASRLPGPMRGKRDTRRQRALKALRDMLATDQLQLDSNMQILLA